MSPGPLALYRQRRDAGLLSADPAQALAAGFPIHPGAMRYYVEAGLVPPPEERDPPPADTAPSKPAAAIEAARSAPVKAALLEFIARGKGFAGNHGAGDNWHDWPEGKEIIGAEFLTHPFGRIQIKVDDPGNPVAAVFNSSIKLAEASLDLGGQMVDPAKLVLDGILDRDDLPDGVIDLMQRREIGRAHV